MAKHIALLISLILCCIAYSQDKLNPIDKSLNKFGNKTISFSVANTLENNHFLIANNIKIKRSTKDYTFFSAPANWIQEQINNKHLYQPYIERSFPVVLDDTARAMHFVNQAHNGQSPLQEKYTGKNVIVAYVDQGIDFTHEDFLTENGKSRVIRYWDHTVETNGSAPTGFGYGQVCTNIDIDNGTCNSTESGTAHGTTVAGIGSGDGSANGKNTGMAPDSKIIVIESNFNLPNWSLTIADACEYVFKVADSLKMPAIVNLSLGSYIGSHDGKDPAAQYIESLLDEKPGRMVVAAAGNSGTWANYHIHNDVNTDTSFTWFGNNPTGVYAANSIFFDLWSETNANDWNYSFGATSPTYQDVGFTNYKMASVIAGTNYFDTIYNANGDKIADIIVNTEIIGTSMHLEGLINVDSLDYLYSFNTTGSGSYDVWSTSNYGMGPIIETVPNISVYPNIDHYIAPDKNQTIVSSWNCSEKVVSVGNVRCRAGHIDKNGNQYYPADVTSPGDIAPSSSKGPTRLGITKPNIGASGDVTLAAAPAWLLNNPAYNSLIDEGGFHARNGGTSMASPTVAGIAALYLEKCNRATYSDFLNDIQATAIVDQFTGIVPNNAFGYGKINAFDLLNLSNYNVSINGDSIICQDPVTIAAVGIYDSINWFNSSFLNNVTLSTADSVYAIAFDNRLCRAITNSITVEQGEIPPTPSITFLNNAYVGPSAAGYQWFLDGNAINGQDNQVYFPISNGYYHLGVVSEDGCWSYSDSTLNAVGLNEFNTNIVQLSPNPTSGITTISSINQIEKIEVLNALGKIVYQEAINTKNHNLDLSILNVGIYFIRIETDNRVQSIRIIKK